MDAIKGRLAYICEKEKINCSEDALDLIASMSDGAMRDAISFLDQAAAMASGALITPESIEEMTGTVNIDFIADFATILIEGSFDKLPVKCKELADSGRDFIQFTLDLAEFFRNLLIIRVVPNPVQLISASAKTKQRMYEIANLTNSQTLTGFISSFSKTVSDLKWSPSVRTSFEIAMLRLCGRKIRMEEAPLVIPDFSKLQAQAAKEISEGTAVKKPSPFASASEEKPEPAPAPEAPKAEEPAPLRRQSRKRQKLRRRSRYLLLQSPWNRHLLPHLNRSPLRHLRRKSLSLMMKSLILPRRFRKNPFRIFRSRRSHRLLPRKRSTRKTSPWRIRSACFLMRMQITTLPR